MDTRRWGEMVRASEIRSDIQGLRAVAVLLVIFYHLELPLFAGGFIGVDIFFVISGYIITSLLVREASSSGSIDLVRFWSRRMRRLLPNGLAVVVFTLILSAILLPGYRRPDLSADITAAALFYSNFHFAQRAIDYFAMDVSPSPLLHFWSLSLEEQFYFLWPPILLLTIKLSKHSRYGVILVVLILAMTASYLLNLHFVETNQPFALFSLFTRAWQIAAGASLATMAGGDTRRRLFPGWAGWIGTAVIVAALTSIDDTVPYPGVYSLLPVLGTVLLLGCRSTGPGSGAHRLLAGRSLCFVGDRSYSLYLWHWPVIIFLRPYLPAPAGTPLLLAAIAVAGLVSYSAIEDPIRRGAFRLAPLRAVLSGGLATLLVAGGGLALPALPVAASDPAIVEAIQRAKKDLGADNRTGCHLGYDGTELPLQCAFGVTSSPKEVALFGDSHASQWFAPLEAAAKAQGWRLLSMTKSACPSADITVHFALKHARYEPCDIWRERMVQKLITDHPALVILANSSWYSGWVYDRTDWTVLTHKDAEDELAAGLVRTVGRLHDAGIRVAIVRDTPLAYKDVFDCLEAKGGRRCDRPRVDAFQRRDFEAPVAQIFPDVRTVSFSDDVCGPSTCPVLVDGEIIYRDYFHLRPAYTAKFANIFAELLQ